MAAVYEFYKNPRNKFSKDEKIYHARLVSNGTVGIERIAEEIQNYSSFSAGDIKGVLEMLVTVAARNLYHGFNVNLEGLGTLQMTLECPAEASDGNAHKKAVRFRSVTFRPSASLKEKLKRTPLTHVGRNVHSNEISEKKIDELLRIYYNSHETMTRRDFQELCGLTRSTAIRLLNKLKENGKIVNISGRYCPIYKKGEI